MNREERLEHDGITLDRRIQAIFGLGSLVFLVGGAVRDEIAGVKPKDRDYIVLFQTVTDMEKAAHDAGYKTKTLVVAKRRVGLIVSGPGLPDEGVEVCPPRREVSTGGGHKDFRIEPIPVEEQRELGVRNTIYEDLGRRDWTVNAMARHVGRDRALFDPYSATDDLLNGQRLRLVNDDALMEDPLRIFRGAYLVAKFGLYWDAHVRGKIDEAAQGVKLLSKERIAAELNKIMLAADPVDGLRAITDWHLWPSIDPFIATMVNFDQRSKYHNQVLMDHCLTVLNHTVLVGPHPDGDEATLRLRWGAFLHDVGKTVTQEEKGDGFCRYHGHDIEGANLVRQHIGPNLKWPRKFTEHVATILQHHMIEPSRKEAAGRKIRRQVANDDVLFDVFMVRLADMLAHPTMTEEDHTDPLYEVWNKAIIALDEPCFRGDLVITGKDIDAQGPVVGQIFDRLVSDVIGNPELNEREWLLAQAGRYTKELT